MLATRGGHSSRCSRLTWSFENSLASFLWDNHKIRRLMRWHCGDVLEYDACAYMAHLKQPTRIIGKLVNLRLLEKKSTSGHFHDGVSGNGWMPNSQSQQQQPCVSSLVVSCPPAFGVLYSFIPCAALFLFQELLFHLDHALVPASECPSHSNTSSEFHSSQFQC